MDHNSIQLDNLSTTQSTDYTSHTNYSAGVSAGNDYNPYAAPVNTPTTTYTPTTQQEYKPSVQQDYTPSTTYEYKPQQEYKPSVQHDYTPSTTYEYKPQQEYKPSTQTDYTSSTYSAVDPPAKKDTWNGVGAESTTSTKKEDQWNGGNSVGTGRRNSFSSGVTIKKKDEWNGAGADTPPKKEMWHGDTPTPPPPPPTKYNYNNKSSKNDTEAGCDCDCACPTCDVSCPSRCDRGRGVTMQRILAPFSVLCAIAINIAVVFACYDYGKKGDVVGYAVVSAVVSAGFIPVWFIVWYANSLDSYKCCTHALIIPVGIMFPLFAGLFGGFAGYTADLHRIALLPPISGSAADIYSLISSGTISGGYPVHFSNTTYLLTRCRDRTVDYADDSDDVTTYTYIAPIVDCISSSCSESNIPVMLYAYWSTSITDSNPPWDASLKEGQTQVTSFGYSSSAVNSIGNTCPNLAVNSDRNTYKLINWKSVDEARDGAALASNALFLTGIIAPSGIFFIFFLMGCICINKNDY